jgi:Mg-chelatase subunit ChlD
MPAPSFLGGLPKPILFGLYGAVGGLLGAILLGEPAWQLLKPPASPPPPPQVAVGASTSVKIYPGTKSTFTVKVARERFDGPVAVKFEKLPPGISLASVTVPQGTDETEATVEVGSEVPQGTTNVTITGEAQNGAMKAPPASMDIEVIAPPPSLAIAVSPNLAVYTRGEGKFVASIARRGYEEEVSIRVEGLPAGIAAVPAVIPRGGNDVEVTLKATDASPTKVTKLTVVAEATAASGKGLKATAPTQIDVKTPPIAPVDVVFVLDVTASMQWALNDLKNGIGKFADALSKAQIDFRLGLVTFQDLTIPGEKVEVILFDGAPFTANPATFRDKVGLLKAEGGGDIPESSLEGLTEAVKMPFRQGTTKMILLITDAPPKVVPESNTSKAVKAVAKMVKEKGIDSVRVVADKLDEDTYQPLREAGTFKRKEDDEDKKYSDIRELIRDEGGFEGLLNTFGRAVTLTAMARSADSKPEVSPPPPPPKVGDTAALKKAEPPQVPSIKGVQASGTYSVESKGQLTLAIGVWSGAIAAMLCLALLSGQNHYLRGQFPPVIRALAGFIGGLLVGTVGGAAGQGLFLMAQASAFRILGWTLLGGLAGTGLSLFIPNMKWYYGLAGGAIGGAAGGLGYMVVEPLANEIVGRLVGGLVVGFFIGLMVAIVEAAFRRAWLEVRYGRETISVNLGPEPVKVGGDAKMCTVWARGAAPLALRFFIRDGQVICDDAVMKRENPVADGFAKEVGNVTVTVRMGSGAASSQPQSPPPVRLPSPPPKATPSAAARAPMMDDDYDGLPMAMSPPPAKPAAPGVPVATARPASPPTPASPSASTAPRPPSPPVPPSYKPAPPSIPSKPPAPPAPSVAKPAVPVPPPAAPKPAAPPPPASTSKHPDACPGCGRVNAGKPKTRYCMVCDQTY